MQKNNSPNSAYLQKIIPEKNQYRFYRMIVCQTLFGEWTLIREWGRIGSNGTKKSDFFPTEARAREALENLQEKKEKRGYIKNDSRT